MQTATGLPTAIAKCINEALRELCKVVTAEERNQDFFV
jgi:hypothetical protein